MSEENKGKKVEIVNQTYRLSEMADAMRQSISNAQNVADQQVKLINIVANSEEVNDFKDFIESCEKQVDNLHGQVAALNVRAGLLEQVVEICEKDGASARLVSMLLKALGIFEEQNTQKN